MCDFLEEFKENVCSNKLSFKANGWCLRERENIDLSPAYNDKFSGVGVNEALKT